jgi:hypothetical protein
MASEKILTPKISRVWVFIQSVIQVIIFFPLKVNITIMSAAIQHNLYCGLSYSLLKSHLMRLAHIGLRVNNLYTMKLFYIKVLGFKEKYFYKSKNTPGLETVFLKRGSMDLELLRYPGSSGTGNGTHLALRVKNPDKQAELLQRLGVNILKGPRTTGDGCRE